MLSWLRRRKTAQPASSTPAVALAAGQGRMMIEVVRTTGEVEHHEVDVAASPEMLKELMKGNK